MLDEVPRHPFIPDAIWIFDDARKLLPLDKAHDPDRWRAAVEADEADEADEPIITQLNGGQPVTKPGDEWPSSSCSTPSIVAAMLTALDVRRGQSVLEIGTGTGWNAAVLCRRVGTNGGVITIEIDPAIAQAAASTLAAGGYSTDAITGDGALGHLDEAPYDRVISTAAIRDVVPAAWLDQVRPGGRLVTPWGTDWSNGALLTVAMDDDRRATGRFSGNLAFMRLRDQRAALYGFEPSDDEISRQADVSTTDCRGWDLAAMLDQKRALFAIGARVPDCYQYLEWNHFAERHHLLDLDDGRTKSFARLDWNVSDPAPFTVYQLGPRRLWDEVECAYRWWERHDKPGIDRFGWEFRDDRQWLWLDEPETVIRDLT